jgi:hypothetical protein
VFPEAEYLASRQLGELHGEGGFARSGRTDDGDHEDYLKVPI